MNPSFPFRSRLTFFGAFGLTLLAACAAPRTKTSTPLMVEAPAPAAHPARQMLVVIPLNDNNIAGWVKLLDLHPKLRLVLAVSPRFKRVAQDALLRAKLDALQRQGRLALALQLPNAPVLPLLMDSDSAKDAVPAATPLPEPPFMYPDDVIQVVASAKAEFYRAWHALPHGLVLPYGAASPALLSAFDKQGFNWIVAALGAPAVDGAYRGGSVALWDAAPMGTPAATRVLVWDERVHPEKLSHFIGTALQNAQAAQGAFLLPTDAGLSTQPLPAPDHWQRRTWTAPDWTAFIGSAAKNAAWEALRKTREALEKYKNSGQASVKRLDQAFEEMYTAENSNFLTALDNANVSAQAAEERAHEFQATLTAAYHIIGQNPPDDLFAASAATQSGVRTSTLTATAEVLPDGSEHVVFDDPAGDDHGDGRLADPPGNPAPGSYDLRRFEIWATTQSVQFSVKLGALSASALGGPRNPGPLIDVYIDLNHEANIGTSAFLNGRGLNAAVADAWEYAIALSGTQATVYRTQGSGSEAAGSFPLSFDGGAVRFSLPRTVLRGSPRRWGYQVLVMAADPASTENAVVPLIPQPARGAPPLEGATGSLPPVYDLLDPSQPPQAQLLEAIETGKRSDVPFVHARSAK